MTWKNAASVIIASKKLARNAAVSKGTSKILDGYGTKNLDIQNSTKLSNICTHKYISNYDILMLKRSGKSKFMPSAFVYPGGKIADEDYSCQWLNIFNEVKQGNLIDKFPSPPFDRRAPMFIDKFVYSPVSNDIAFRLSAIRETFEETGILICRTLSDLADSKWVEGCPSLPTKSHDQISSNKLQGWRKDVYKDPLNFIKLCECFGIVPDVWSLHEWSNWLTPTNMEKQHSNRRYDTAFYMCTLPYRIQAEQDDQEIVGVEWISPFDTLQKFHSEEVWLAPPQVYELSRLCNFPDISELEDFSKKRGLIGCERWLPVRTNCTDGIIAVLPGDELYPDNVDLHGERPAPSLEMTIDEALLKTKKHHRTEFRSLYNSPTRVTIPQKYDHVEPVSPDKLKTIFELKT